VLERQKERRGLPERIVMDNDRSSPARRCSHLELDDLRDAMELPGKATGVAPDALGTEAHPDSVALDPIRVPSTARR